MGKEDIIINEDFKMKVVNFLKIYGNYGGILVRNKNDKKYVSGEINLDDIITNKKDFIELKSGVKEVLDYCYENRYDTIEKVMNKFYVDECSDIKKKYGNFFDRH